MSEGMKDVDGNEVGVDLSDEQVLRAQWTNVVQFAKVRKRFVLSFISIGLPFAFGYMRLVEKSQEGWIVLVTMLVMVNALVQAFRYKCPHCGTPPMSVSGGVGTSEIRMQYGLNPFAQSCQKCGYYLSQHRLEHDIEAAKGRTS